MLPLCPVIQKINSQMLSSSEMQNPFGQLFSNVLRCSHTNLSQDSSFVSCANDLRLKYLSNNCTLSTMMSFSFRHYIHVKGHHICIFFSIEVRNVIKP